MGQILPLAPVAGVSNWSPEVFFLLQSARKKSLRSGGKLAFLNLGTTGILNQVIICCEKLRMGFSGHCRMFNSIPWPVTTKDISSIPYPSCDKQKCHQALLNTSKGQTSPDWEPLVYPRNSMERGAWWATIHGVTKSQTWLSDFHIHPTYKVTSQRITSFKVYSLCFQISYPWISEFPMRVIVTFYHVPSFDKNVLGTCVHACPTLCDPMDCSPPACPVHGILQAKILERVAMPFSRGSSRPRDRTRTLLCLTHISRRVLYHCCCCC